MWNRALGNVAPERRSSCDVGLEQSYLLNPGLKQSNPPVIRRERQRYSDRPRSHSASGLAASVGLPCPFSSLEWLGTSETQCQPNLDTITFPGTVPENPTNSLSGKDNQISASAISPKDTPDNLEKATQDLSSSKSQEVQESLSSSSSDPPSCHFGLPTSHKGSISSMKPLPSLRISESNFSFTPSAAVSQVEDEVFLTPTLPQLHPLSNREGNFSEEPQIRVEVLDVMLPEESQKLNRYKHMHFILDKGVIWGLLTKFTKYEWLVIFVKKKKRAREFHSQSTANKFGGDFYYNTFSTRFMI